MSYSPSWLAHARPRARSDGARIEGQPNNFREKMAAFGVHDQSVVDGKLEGEKRGETAEGAKLDNKGEVEKLSEEGKEAGGEAAGGEGREEDK